MSTALREGRENWYRNESWSVATEIAFLAKLRRTRGQGPQCLKIQIATLADTHPGDALRLAALYFDDWSEPMWDGEVWISMARAYTALNQLEEAAAHYQKAIEWQHGQPNYLIGAESQFAWFAAEHRLTRYYDEARAGLDATTAALPSFPLERFRIHASMAVFAAHAGNPVNARRYAKAALKDAAAAQKDAAQDRSGFASHPALGLVHYVPPHIIAQMNALVRSS